MTLQKLISNRACEISVASQLDEKCKAPPDISPLWYAVDCILDRVSET